MGTIPLPLPWPDEHRVGHPPALLDGRDPKDCPFCRAEQPPEPSVERLSWKRELLRLYEYKRWGFESFDRASEIVEAALAEQQADLTRLREQVEGLREALGQYADQERWSFPAEVIDTGKFDGRWWFDPEDTDHEAKPWLLARAALAQAERPEEAGAGG